MKTIKSIVLGFLLLGSAAAGQAAPPFTNATWGISWDQPTNMPVLSSWVPGTNQAYQVYATQTLNTPLTNWVLQTTWTSWYLVTNPVTGVIQLSNNITMPFSQTFFYVNPTNIWGAAPLLSGYGGLGVTGPPWSSVNNSLLNRQGP